MAVAQCRPILNASFTRVGFYGPHSTPAGTTKNTGSPSDLPVRRRVRLHHMDTGLLLREMWSDAVTGAYRFHGLPAGEYYAPAFDHTSLYNGELVAGIKLPTP